MSESAAASMRIMACADFKSEDPFQGMHFLRMFWRMAASWKTLARLRPLQQLS